MNYTDKNMIDSKKVKMSLIGVIAAIITPILYTHLGPVTGTVVDHIAPGVADLIIGIITFVYVNGQAKVDAVLAGNGKSGSSPGDLVTKA